MIKFNEYGYCVAEKVCAPFKNRTSEPILYWITRGLRFLKKSNIEVASIVLNLKDDVKPVIKSGQYQIISHKPYKDKPSNISYLANKEGLIFLIHFALKLGDKIPEAHKILKELNVSLDDVDLLIGKYHKTGGIVEEEENLLENKEVCIIETNNDVPVKELPNISSLLEVEKIPNQIYKWKKQDVILSSAFAVFCGLETRRINERIRKCVKRDELIENIDFFHLNDDKSEGFCEAHQVDLTSNEVRNGLYLLTQVGVNKLCLHFNNARAVNHRNVALTSAAKVQELDRKGIFDTVTSAMQTLTDRLTDKINQSTDKLNERFLALSEKQIEIQERLLKVIEDKPQQVDVKHLEGIAYTAGYKGALESRTFHGHLTIPDHLISNDEREKYIPGVNHDIPSKFLEHIDHPSEDWWLNREAQGLEMLKIKSYLKEGIGGAAVKFYKSSQFVTRTDYYFKFSCPVGNYQVARKPEKDCIKSEEDIKSKLNEFMRLFCKFNPNYEYNKDTEELIKKDSISEVFEKE
jgi:hypothetical protein